jgi:hypothetical protein
MGKTGRICLSPTLFPADIRKMSSTGALLSTLINLFGINDKNFLLSLKA